MDSIIEGLAIIEHDGHCVAILGPNFGRITTEIISRRVQLVLRMEVEAVEFGCEVKY